MIGRSTKLGQTTLDCLVVKTTPHAVLIMTEDFDERWVPRKVCLDGASLDEGDTDVVVADWWLKQEGML